MILDYMNKTLHILYIGTMVVIVILVTAYLSYTGYTYYMSPMEERFYHEHHDWFKPSGIFGHGLGIVGSLMMLFGVVIYIARKRYNFMVRQLRLKYLLEFHIFLCTLGPILVLFHTAFKFGGIVSVAFWSMVAVVVSGVIGRFIYIQIPRTIEGRELSLNEVKNMRSQVSDTLRSNVSISENILGLIEDLSGQKRSENTKSSFIAKYFNDKKSVRIIGKKLRQEKIKLKERKAILKMIKEEMSLSNRIERLQTMQRLFKYWHVAHLPFALIMLIILIIHIGVTLAFGYKWIF